MLLEIVHPELATQKTYTSAEVLASASSSTVENGSGFSSGDLVLFGKYGQEKTERVTLSGTTGNTQLDHSTGPVFSHPARTPVQMMVFDQAEISRADSEGGSYTVLTTVDLNFDEDVTLYNDSTGTTSSWYKIRYKNSSTGVYSSYSPEQQGTGYDDDAMGSMLEEVLVDFGDPTAKKITRTRVRSYLKAGVRTLAVKIIKMYPDHLRSATTQDFTSSQTYNLPDRFLGFIRVDVNYAGTTRSDATKATFESEGDGFPSTTYTTNDPRIFIRGGSVGFRPTPTGSGRAWYVYWAYPPVMSDDGDTHGLPFGARDVLVAHALYRLWLSKDQDKSRGYRSLYKDLEEEFIEFVGQQRQQITQPNEEVVFGGDLYDSWF